MGLLKISENGRYLTKNGAPFFWLGDTIWPAPCAYSEKELEFYFKRRKEQGFTVVHIMLTWVSLGGELVAVEEGDTKSNMPMWLNNDSANGKEAGESVVSGEKYAFTSPACCDDALLVLKK
jgi:hypothetical protein